MKKNREFFGKNYNLCKLKNQPGWLIFFILMRRTVSRVMSLDGHLSRPDVTTWLKRPTRKQAGHFMLSVQSCFEWGLQCPFCYQKGGSLLHCPFTLTGEYPAVCSLLHFPGSHLHRPLAGILPYEARTFLVCVLSAIASATIYPTHK